VLQNEDSLAFKACDCLESCNSIEYSVYVHNTKMVGDGTSKSYPAVGTFYFSGDEFIARRRSASFGTVELLSNVGGLLGLFLGMSVLSVVEAIYFFVIRFISNLWWQEAEN
jgi:Amiloride-sensitive sodium channel